MIVETLVRIDRLRKFICLAEPRKRDAPLRFALGDERKPGLLERLGRHGQTVAEPDESPLLLEEERQLRVLDLHGLQAEPRFELGGRSLAGSQRR